MFWTVTASLLEGFFVTIKIFLLTLLFALPLGLIISFGSMSKFKPLKWLVKIFVWIIRGTPLMLQLIAIFYVPGIIGKWAVATESTNSIMVWLGGWSVPERFMAVMIA